MTCNFSTQTIDKTIEFHGHSCPGLAIGIRAAEYAKREFPDTSPTSLVCVTETDMCGVDAIQYLTGCTYGKGNLVHLDYGKMAFSFYDREKKRGIRLRLKPACRGDGYRELVELMTGQSSGPLSQSDQKKMADIRENLEKRLMDLPLEEIFAVEELHSPPPRSPRILESLTCNDCGEQVMESRTRRFGGKTLCIPCYSKVEQKI